MKITITAIDLASERPMGNIKAPGYKVHFTSSLAVGTAVFVPARTASLEMQGQSFWVELNQETVENLVRLPDDSSQHPVFASTSQSGDFNVRGVITSVVPFITASAGDASFILASDELGDITLQEGDWVEFLVRELSLWDEAI